MHFHINYLYSPWSAEEIQFLCVNMRFEVLIIQFFRLLVEDCKGSLIRVEYALFNVR